MELAETRLADKTAGAVFTNVLGAAKAAFNAEVDRLSLHYSAYNGGQQYQTPVKKKQTQALGGGVILMAILVLLFLSRGR